jgi:hypothetical protein
VGPTSSDLWVKRKQMREMRNPSGVCQCIASYGNYCGGARRRKSHGTQFGDDLGKNKDLIKSLLGKSLNCN